MAVLMLRFHLAVATLLIAASVVASTGPTKNNHEVLGITRAATFEDIQYAYQKLSQKHGKTRTAEQPAEDWFVEAQLAYEAISNQDMQEDALRFVDYWSDVIQIRDDHELRSFTEFKPDGSSRLRMIVIMSSPEERHFEAFATATKFATRVRVGQTCVTDTHTPAGEVGEFLASLKLRQYPAVVLFDPLTRGMKVRYGLDGIGAEIERLLKGDLVSTDKIAGIQELDEESYEARCGSTSEDEAATASCSTTLIFATSGDLEHKRKAGTDLFKTLRPFVDACRALQGTQPGTVCFWLRLNRAPQWATYLSGKGLGDADVALFSLMSGESDEISMAPANIANGATDDINGWFRTVFDGEASKESFAWPSLPKAVARSDEPQVGSWERWTQKAEYHSKCFFITKCREMQFDLVHQEFLVFVRAQGYEPQYVQIMNLDTEMKIAAVGAVMLVFLVIIGFMKAKLFPGGPKNSEEGAIVGAEFYVNVHLKKTGGQKYGMGIASHGSGGLKVTGVDDGGLLHQWNMAEPRLERRICEGDRIIFASGVVGGKPVQETQYKNIVKILQSEEANMIVERNKDDRQVQKMVGTCVLDGVALQGNAELAPVHGTAGKQFEVASLGPALLQWNDLKKSQGACCTQQLEVGDRIVSVQGNVDVASQLGTVPATLVIVRWRAVSNISPQRVQVTMERSTPEDRWGMQIRRRIADPKHMEVLEVVESGLLARWNGTPGNPQIMKGDRIVSANGLQELTAITNALQESKLVLAFERWVDSSSGENPTNNGAPVAAPGFGMPASAPGMMGMPPPMVAGMPPPMPGTPMPGLGAPAPMGMQKPPAPMPGLMQPSAPMPGFAPAPQAAMAPAPMAAMAPRAQMPPPTFSAPARAQAPMVQMQAAPSPEAPSAPVLLMGVVAVFVVLGLGLWSSGQLAEGSQGKLSPEVRQLLDKINPKLYWEIAAMLMLLGALLTLVFFRNEARQGGILAQLCVSALASTLLGFGSFFMLAWAGVYV